MNNTIIWQGYEDLIFVSVVLFEASISLSVEVLQASISYDFFVKNTCFVKQCVKHPGENAPNNGDDVSDGLKFFVVISFRVAFRICENSVVHSLSSSKNCLS